MVVLSKNETSIENGEIQLEFPEKPTSRNQRYISNMLQQEKEKSLQKEGQI